MLLALGVSHKTAPIDIRERLAFSQETIPNALKTLANQVPIDEVALLSTCNRTEFYCSASKLSLSKQLLTWWQEYLAASFDVKPYLYVFSGENAVKHLMRVASGLDSMVLGEPQILGQLKTAYLTASQTGVVGKRLARLFQTSFSVAKRVRTTTSIAIHPVSVAYAAVILAKQIFSDLSQATILLMGAGENIELTIQHLVAKQAKKFIIVNRTVAHAEALVTRYGGKALPLEELATGLAEADIVMSAMAADKPILTQTILTRAFSGCKRRPILMVDLGVPRNIDPNIGNNEDIYLYTIDDLTGIVTENLKNRQLAAVEAESVIDKASHLYMRWTRSQQHNHTLRALRAKSDKIKNDALTIALRQLEKGKDPKAVMTQLAHQLTQKLMHQPTLGLRKVSTEEAENKIVVIKELFSIE